MGPCAAAAAAAAEAAAVGLPSGELDPTWARRAEAARGGEAT
eukprot:gene8150-7146_t